MPINKSVFCFSIQFIDTFIKEDFWVTKVKIDTYHFELLICDVNLNNISLLGDHDKLWLWAQNSIFVPLFPNGQAFSIHTHDFCLFRF